MQQLLVKVPLQYRPFILPLIVALAILVASFTGGPFLLGKINEENLKIDELKVKNTRLEAKKNVLSAQNKQELLAKTQAAVDAVPGETPTLAALSSVNNLAFDNQLSLVDFRVNEKKDSKGSSTELVINTDGPIAATLAFLNQLKNTAPLVKVTGITASVQAGIARAKTTLLSVWSPLPSNIGKTESAVEPLTSAEEEIATKLSGLKKSGVDLEELPPAAGRTNPFTR